jgi:hypothetical protein
MKGQKRSARAPAQSGTAAQQALSCRQQLRELDAVVGVVDRVAADVVQPLVHCILQTAANHEARSEQHLEHKNEIERCAIHQHITTDCESAHATDRLQGTTYPQSTPTRAHTNQAFEFSERRREVEASARGGKASVGGEERGRCGAYTVSSVVRPEPDSGHDHKPEFAKQHAEVQEDADQSKPRPTAVCVCNRHTTQRITRIHSRSDEPKSAIDAEQSRAEQSRAEQHKRDDVLSRSHDRRDSERHHHRYCQLHNFTAPPHARLRRRRGNGEGKGGESGGYPNPT